MGYLQNKHDIGILRTDGTTKIGLMLARDKNDVPAYSEDFDDYLTNQVWNDAPGYGALQALKEIPIIEDDFSGGGGQEVYDSTDPHRYHESYGMDLRWKGNVLPGQYKFTGTKPTAPATPTIVNGDMELATGWGGDGSFSATQAHSPTQSRLLNYGGGGAANLVSSQDVTVIPGATYTVTFWVYVGTIPGAGLQGVALYDGATLLGMTSAGGVTGSWIQKTVSGTMTTASSTLTIKLLAGNGAGNDAFTYYFDDVSIASNNYTYGVIKSYVEFNDKLFVGAGKTLLNLNSTDIWAVAGVLPYDITDMCVFGDYLFIAIGGTHALWYMSTTEVFVESTLANPEADFLCPVSTTLWKAILPRELRSNTGTGLNGGTAWSNTTLVDVATLNITDLLSFNNALYVMKEDRPYYIDSSGAVQILTNITRSITTANGGKNSIEWLGKIYMPWGNSLLEYDNGTFTWRSPFEYFKNASGFCGEIQALACDDMYLYAIVDNTTNVELLAGRLEDIDGTTKWVWHPFSEFTLAGAETAIVSSVYTDIIYIASTVNTDATINGVYLGISTTGLPTQLFAKTGYFTTPWYHCNFKSDNKAFIKLTLTLSGTTAARYFTVSYMKWGDSAWTSIGDFYTVPTTTKYLPLDSGSLKPVSTMIKFKVAITSDSFINAFFLKSLDCRAVLYPTPRNLVNCTVRCADNIIDKSGMKLEANGAVIRAAQEEAKNSTYPFTFYNIDGTAKTMKILPTKPLSRIVKDEKSGNIERYYYLTMQEITTST